MTNVERRSNLLQLITILGVLILPFSAEGAVSLNVTPTEGGASLRFGRISDAYPVNREVKIRVSSSDGLQYQVFQRLVEPLIKETGSSLDPRAVQTYSLPGSNSSGTLYLQNLDTLSQADQLVYTSDSGGGSDSFTMVYTALPEYIPGSGRFSGRIQYLIRPLGSGSQQSAFLNVYLEASNDLQVTLAGTKLSDTIRLSLPEEVSDAGDIRIDFEGKAGETITIYQEVDQFPQSGLFEELGGDTIQYRISDAAGSAAREFKALERKPALVYRSDDNDGSLFIDFRLNPQTAVTETAGVYRGRLKYIVETEDDRKEQFFTIEARVDPAFKLEVGLPPEGVRFPNVLPGEPPIVKEISVTINSNLGRPYQVIQKIPSGLTNAQGDEIAPDHFNVQMELPDDQPGRVAYTEYQPVRSGENVIFFSDSKGSPAKFLLRYRLKSYPEIVPGDYSAQVVFSLLEM